MSTGAVAAALRASGKLGPTERLEKVLFELVETDRAYVEVRAFSFGVLQSHITTVV